MTGTVELLPAGSFGVDDSFTVPSIAAMLAIGVQFESRYICIESDQTRGKLLTKDRVKRCADAGILEQVNYEQSEGTTLQGEPGGRKHGKVAADWRYYLEMPPDLPIVVTTDIGVTQSQYGAISDFCAAFKEESGGPIGHYHGTTLCAHLEGQGLCDLTWMAMATSWSPGGETPAVHVRQKGYVLGSCDANYVRQPTPFWNFNGESPAPPAPTLEVDMSLVVLLNSQGWWKGLDDQGYARSIYGPEADARMAASSASKVPIPSVTISDAEWDSWPPVPPPSAGQSIRGVHITSVPGDAAAY